MGLWIIQEKGEKKTYFGVGKHSHLKKDEQKEKYNMNNSKSIMISDNLLESNNLDLAWATSLFQQQASPATYAVWLGILQENEFETFDDLILLDSAGWESLPLPLEVKETMQKFLVNRNVTSPTTDTTDNSEKEGLPFKAEIRPEIQPEIRPITQIDCIVIDISGSMRSSSNVDHDKTREDVSKMLFHTLVDKIISLELSHAVGLSALCILNIIL